jgi:signal transduction histidine kinase
LDYAQVEAGQLDLEREPFDLASLADEVVNRMQVRAHANDVTLTLATPPGGAMGKWDRRRIDQTITHLLDNALKFTPRGGRIEVEVSGAAAEVLVEVRDTGPGIAPEHLPHIFEKFYQADPILTRSHNGAGLGLSLCKSFVEAHGGYIGAMSEVGQGSRFWFSVPTAL